MFDQQQFTPPEFKPSSGHIVYTRWMGAKFIVQGQVIGEREVKVRRYEAIVTEYLVRPAQGVTNLSAHIVDESDVVELNPVCPDCGDHGYLSIHGDNDVPCNRCYPISDDSEVF